VKLVVQLRLDLFERHRLRPSPSDGRLPGAVRRSRFGAARKRATSSTAAALPTADALQRRTSGLRAQRLGRSIDSARWAPRFAGHERVDLVDDHGIDTSQPVACV